MNRREFLMLAGSGVVSMAAANAESMVRNAEASWRNALAKQPTRGETLAAAAKKAKAYSIVILGDTHFDTEPADVYHSNYNEKVEWLNNVQRAEFKRNGEMWRERCPKMVKRAVRLIDKDTRMAFQMGDLVQGDCGKGEVHEKMLDDVMNYFKGEFKGLPFVTVVGNHDIRGVDAKEVYHKYMPQRMSQELGQSITKTTFSFWIGKDVYIVVDFNDPDDAEIDKLLDESTHARYTFVISHGALFPMDEPNGRWMFHGDKKENDKRRYFRRRFAERNVIFLCGHTHSTEYYQWEGDGGRLTQMTMNSVWSAEEKGHYTVVTEGGEKYGTRRLQDKTPDEVGDTELYDEYRPGMKEWALSWAAGSYKLNVSNKGVTLDFYAGDSEEVSHSFKLR